VNERIKYTENDSKDRLRTRSKIFQAYSTAVAESPDVKDGDQLALFICRCNTNSVGAEEFSEFIPVHGPIL
jgi:hypothetical protein